MVFGVDFHHLFQIITQALGPLCVLYAPTIAIKRALKTDLFNNHD
jgi:hypothetical protein